jgi:glycogen synthase
MLNGIFGSNLNNIQAMNQESKISSSSTVSDANFKGALADVVKSAQIAIADKGIKGEVLFNKWRDLEDNLYFDPEELEEEAAEDYLKKLKRILQGRLAK